MMKYMVTLTLDVTGENALDALNRVINPEPGTVRNIVNIRVEEFWDAPTTFQGGSARLRNQAGEEIGPDDEVPEPSPIPNVQLELVRDEPEAEPEGEAPCTNCPEPSEAMPLPEDIPYVKTLSDAGVTLDSVILMVQNFTIGDKVKGVGPLGVKKIRDYLIQTGRLPSSTKATEEPDLTPVSEVTVEPTPPPAAVAPSSTPPPADAPALEEEVRQALAEVCRVHKLPAMKKILQDLGCSGGLGDLDKARFPEALAMAKALLG